MYDNYYATATFPLLPTTNVYVIMLSIFFALFALFLQLRMYIINYLVQIISVMLIE